jgi:hypothetical protein
MIELIACIGLHWIIKYGTILNSIRNYLTKNQLLRELFKCSLCLGFWTGVIIFPFTGEVLLPLASAAACWFFDNINNTLQSVEIKLDN